MKQPRNRRPLLRVVDTASATLVGPDQVPTADLLPEIDWTPRPAWRVEHASDGRIVICQGDQIIAVLPHQLPALFKSLCRSVNAFESARRRVRS